jgi:hypothetical protein
MTGEKIYDFTGVTDYGVSLEAILAGKEKIPSQPASTSLLKDALAAACRGGCAE